MKKILLIGALALAGCATGKWQTAKAEDSPVARKDPAGWAQAMHSPEWVEFMLDEIVKRQVPGDTVVLEEISCVFRGTTARGQSAWVYMVRFHRTKGTAPEVAMVTLVPIPTSIQVIILTKTNL